MQWKARDPVRSPLDKPLTAALVVGSVTTSESVVLYVFAVLDDTVGGFAEFVPSLGNMLWILLTIQHIELSSSTASHLILTKEPLRRALWGAHCFSRSTHFLHAPQFNFTHP